MKYFITFEGIDGSGKSTLSKLVFEKLRENGYKAILTFEPTDSYIGKIVQNFIETNADPFITAFAFIADRIEHCKKIKEWLNQGNIVICDRYAESTYAYQAVQMEDSIDNPIKWLKHLSKNRIIIPDRTFLLIIDPEKAITRIKNRNKLIPFEKRVFLEKVHKNYLKIAKGKRFLKLDATKSIEELVDICYRDIISD